MPLTNAERQKRWIDKNRALHNLRRRKKNLSGKGYSQGDEVTVANAPNDTRASVEILPPAQLSKMDELRQLVKMVSAEPIIPAPKLLVYRNDYGQVINEAQWNILQKRKQDAKDGGYEIDDFSQ